MLAACCEGVSALQSIFPIGPAVRAEAPSAAIYSFVPAGGSAGDRSRCRKAVRQLAEAMGAYLTAEGDGRAVLLADFSSVHMASAAFITCLDLADASRAEASHALGISEAVFVVSSSDRASIEEARIQAAWMLRVLRPHSQEEACGLLLVPGSGGLTVAEAEKRTGLPVCGTLGTQKHIAQLARWFVQE